MSDLPNDDVVASAPIPPPEPSYGYGDRLIDARLAGHDWEDVDRFVGQGTATAQAEGYDDHDIRDYLGLAHPDQTAARFTADAANRVSTDEQFTNKLKSSTAPLAITPLESPSAERMEGYAPTAILQPETANPDPDKPLQPSGLDLADDHMRSSYARALYDDAVLSPRDFAERYTGALGGAAGSDPGVLVRAAGELAQSLPSDRDFADQAISIASSGGVALSPESVQTVRNNLIDHWTGTGADLQDIYKQAQDDPELAAKLTTAPQPPKSMLEQFAQADMAEVQQSADMGQWITDRLKDWYAWRMQQPDATDEGWAKNVAEAKEALTTGKISEDAFNTAMGFVGGNIEGVGAKFAEAIGLLKPAEPMVKLLDPAAAGGIAGEIPFTKSLEPPKPAERPPVENVSRETPATSAPPEPQPRLDFVPEATPAEKMQAIAKDWTEQNPDTLAELRERNDGELPKETDPDFFERLAAGQDPATVELAQGHDATTGIFGFMRNLMADESGSLNLFRTPEQAAAREAYTDARDYMRPLIVQMRSRGEQVMSHFYDQADHWQATTGKVENLFKTLEPHIPEFEAELAKGINGNPMNTMVGNMISYVEGRSMGAAMRHDSPLTPVADGIRYINENVRGMLEDGFNRGVINYNSYFEDYFRHMWTDPNKAATAFEQFQSRVGKLGSSSGLQQRTLPTFEDGIKMGLQPAITNPLELTLFDAGQKIKYLQSAEILKTANDAGYVKWRVKPQDDEVALGSHRTTKGIPNDPQGRDLTAYANPGLANAWNDWLSKGFHERPGATSSIYDKMLYSFNTLNGLKLAVPMFHFMTEVAETTASGMAHSIYLLGSGHPLQAAKELALSFPGAQSVQGVVKGGDIIRQYNSRFITNPAIKALVDAGMRFGPRQEIYRHGSAPNMGVSLRRGQLVNDVVGDIKRVFGDPKEPTDYRIAQAPGRALGMVAHEVGRVLNTVSAPLFDHMIPRLKAFTSVRQMDQFLKDNPLATPEQISTRAQQITRNTDERFGEMNMDNIFWPRGVKQSAQLGMISVGWVYGWARMMASAAGLNIERMAFEANPVAMRSIVGFTMAYALENSLYQYAKTGQAPFSSDTPIKDMFAPRTGGTNQWGTPERALLPSQAKEMVDYFKVAATAAHSPMMGLQAAAEYAQAKGKTPIQFLMALTTGKDAIGNDIAHTAGGWTGYIKDMLNPIFYGALNDRKKGTEISPVETMMGLHPMTKAAQDPAAFYDGLYKQDRRLYKQQISRAKHENKIYINPREVPVDPGDDLRSGRGGSADLRAFEKYRRERGR